GEFFLVTRPSLRPRRHRYPNGGTVIFLRSFVVGVFLCILSFLLAWLSDGLDPNPSSPSHPAWPMLSMNAVRQGLKTSLSWYGAIFAAVYAAFYTRFSSQWTYMAGVYNQIKAIEAQIAASASNNKRLAYKVIASWKAAFIEDADDLHLALKPMFAETIRAW